MAESQSIWSLPNLLALLGLVVSAVPLVYAAFRSFRNWLSKRPSAGPEKEKPEPAGSDTPAEAPFWADSIPAGAGVGEKLEYLERLLGELGDQAREAKRKALDDEALTSKIRSLKGDLREMVFLAEDDQVGDRYELRTLRRQGDLSQVWRAWDQQREELVALKILRYEHYGDATTRECFARAARVLNGLNLRSLPAIYQERGVHERDGRVVLHFYSMELIEGEELEKCLPARRRPPDELVGELLGVAEDLVVAHERGFLHGDISPRSLLVDPTGGVRMVGFEALEIQDEARVRARAGRHSGTFGYAAPEIFYPSSLPDARADIFSLARTITFAYRNKAKLPDPYTTTNFELVDRLNCAAGIKRVLHKALSANPLERQRSMREFIADLGDARTREEESPSLLATLHGERRKVAALLGHSFYGTLAMLLIIRPLMVNWVHLSDRVPVAIFHGVIGAFWWGVLIPAGFLVYYVNVRDRGPFMSYLLAAFFGGLGGLAGGIICAAPSIWVTNAASLEGLGWVTSTTNENWARFWQALLETRMLFAFPLTGTLTGIGVSTFLNLKMNQLKARDLGGLQPVPVKVVKPGDRPLRESIRFVYSNPWAHFLLLAPVLGSWLAIFILSPHDQPAPIWWRSLGEGIVHYWGAVGLCIGFLYGVARSSDDR